MGILNIKQALTSAIRPSEPSIIQPTGCCDSADILKLAQQHAAAFDAVQVQPPQQRATDEISVCYDVVLNLNTLNSGPIPLLGEASRLIYRRALSHPGGRINYVNAGTVTCLYPGCILDAPVKGGFFALAPGSAVNSGAFATITVMKLPGYNLIEPEFTHVPQYGGIGKPLDINAFNWLTGLPDASQLDGINWQTQNINSAAAFFFDVTGIKTVTLILDTDASGGGRITSFDIVPWFQPGGGFGVSGECSTERVTFPALDASVSTRFRFATFAMTGVHGSMGFAVHNTTGGGTFMNFAAVGM